MNAMTSASDPKRHELLEDGYSSREPNEPGLYLLASSETDYEPNHVAVTLHADGRLWIHDPNSGTWHLDLFHNNLIQPVWKQLA